MLDVIWNAILVVLSIYLYIYIGGVDNSTETKLGAAFWPRLVLVLLILTVLINIAADLKNKGRLEKLRPQLFVNFIKSRLFMGMLLCILFAVMLPWIGFVPASILFFVLFGMLLGERRLWMLAMVSICATLLLFVVFQGILSVFLPRGYGMFRSISLTLEGLLSMLGL